MEKDNKVILFAIGVLLGAVISTAAFLICVNTLGTNSSNNSSQQMQMPEGDTPPEMPSGENGSNSQGGTPPEKPSNDNGGSSEQ